LSLETTVMIICSGGDGHIVEKLGDDIGLYLRPVEFAEGICPDCCFTGWYNYMGSDKIDELIEAFKNAGWHSPSQAAMMIDDEYEHFNGIVVVDKDKPPIAM